MAIIPLSAMWRVPSHACLLAPFRPLRLLPFVSACCPPPPRLAFSPRLFVSEGGEMSSGEVGSGAFSCGIFARSNALLVVLVLPYMPWRWGHRMRGIRARLHKLHLFTGRREFLLLGAVNLLGTASPFSCYFFSVPLFSPPRSSCRAVRLTRIFFFLCDFCAVW